MGWERSRTMPELNLEEFIYQVKKELLEGQKKHEGEPGYFRLRDVELEVSVTASYSGKGKLNLQVVQIGSGVAKEHTHTVKLIFDLEPAVAALPYQFPEGMVGKGVKAFGPIYITDPTEKGSEHIPPVDVAKAPPSR
jgi:hypothetical protein